MHSVAYLQARQLRDAMMKDALDPKLIPPDRRAAVANWIALQKVLTDLEANRKPKRRSPPNPYAHVDRNIPPFPKHAAAQATSSSPATSFAEPSPEDLARSAHLPQPPR